MCTVHLFNYSYYFSTYYKTYIIQCNFVNFTSQIIQIIKSVICRVYYREREFLGVLRNILMNEITYEGWTAGEYEKMQGFHILYSCSSPAPYLDTRNEYLAPKLKIPYRTFYIPYGRTMSTSVQYIQVHSI